MSATQQPTDFDPLVDQLPARYVVGIDLGTTNCAVTYVDTQQTAWQIRSLAIPQLVAPHQIEPRDTLPSFHYQPAAGSLESDALKLSWHDDAPDWCVGRMARDEGMKSPGRLISSAKSWLCHTAVDRTAKLLPWQGAGDVQRLSPVEVSARLLGHIRDAWDAQVSDAPLAEQDIVITLPASFDEVARELTVQAAAEAGLPRVVLIEEPQAAFYAWVYKHRTAWPDLVAAGHTILVCDIGGGTSDFTLIQVRQADADDGENAERSGSSEPANADSNASSADNAAASRVQFHRVAVGDHLILGGDNLDLTLAHYLEGKLNSDGALTPDQWDVLVRSCRRVKETLLADDAPDEATVNLPGRGTKLIGGGLQVRVTRAEVETLLVDGFLPSTQLDELPQQGQSGFREFGLPFASDPAISRHLSAFLRAHAGQVEGTPAWQQGAVRPDVVLFNGGFFASPLLRQRLLDVLSDWFGATDQAWQPRLLDNDRLDLAVARGAAYYGMVRRGDGVRIAANLARSYYVEVAGDGPQTQAVCLVPGYAQPGQNIDLDQLTLQLTISQPVEFSLYVSSTRLTDEPGTVVAVNDEQFKSLPPIRTVLKTDRRNQTGTIPVTLHAHLSEIGTIDLWCQATEADYRWRLQFDVRSATQTDRDEAAVPADVEAVVAESTWDACQQRVADVFADSGDAKPAQLAKQLSSTLQIDRHAWPTSLCRRIWESLIEMREGRRRSAAHEARWLNLLGFALRPGYGLAVDDWRVAETWRHVRGKLVHAGASHAESLILWRRIAGGLSAGQQRALAEPLVAALRAAHRASTAVSEPGSPASPGDQPDVVRGLAKGTRKALKKGKRKGQSRAKKSVSGGAGALHESTEAWRLLGALELLEVPQKQQLGSMICDLLPKRKYDKVRQAMIWALGRLGQRQPLYGPLNTVVAVDQASEWCDTLLEGEPSPASMLAVMQLTRRTDDRYRDVDAGLRDRVAQWLRDGQAAPHLVQLVTEGGQLEEEEQGQVFGESLPKGLRLE